MWATIGSIVLKYWVEFLLGAIVTGGGFLVRRYMALDHADRERQQKEYYSTLMSDIDKKQDKLAQQLSEQVSDVATQSSDRYTEITTKISEAMIAGREESKQDDAALQGQINNMEQSFTLLQRGVLAIQGKEFKSECRKMLDPGHTITLEEWEDLDSDHDTYNALGGNHNGDRLYELVKRKYEAHMLRDRSDDI